VFITTVKVIGESSKALVASNFLVNLFITFSLQQLWSAINTQQIIVLFPLCTILLPGNAAYFFSFIMIIASFDIWPVEEYYDSWFNMEATGPLD